MDAVVTAPCASLGRAVFGFGGRVLSVDVGDAAAAHILQTAYAPLRMAAARVSHHSASMRRLGDGRLHVRFDRHALTAGPGSSAPPLLSAYYAVKEVFARFACAQPSAMALYGASMAINESGVLLLGPAGIGKTILAMHLASQGARFLGDETAMLDLRNGTIRALPRRPSLRESALPYLQTAELREALEGSANVIDTGHGRFWYALDPAECAAVPSDEPYLLRTVIVVRERTGAPSLRRVDAEAALNALTQRAYARPSQLLEVSALKRTIRNVTAYEMNLGEPAESAAAVLSELRACV